MESDRIMSSPLKRPAPDDEHERPLNLKGTQFIPTPPTTNESPSNSLNGFKRELSPAASISTLSSIQDVSSVGAPEAARPVATISSAQPAKKRKLTVAEKAEQQRKRDAAAQEKAEKKQKKEAEAQEKAEQRAELKAKKDEEKRQKDEERRQKAEEREAAQREKELKAEQKVQEQLKKERSQMRLGAFFGGAVTTKAHSPQASPNKAMTRRRSLSLETYDNMQGHPIAATSSQEQLATPVVSDYRKYFLPYEPKPHTTLPPGPITADQDRFDAELNSDSAQEQYDLGLSSQYASISDHFREARPRGRPFVRVKDCWNDFRGSQVDLTTGNNDPLQRLAQVPVRYLYFDVDVRPPYSGTFTSVDSPRAAKRMRRNPFTKGREGVDYDYDSEAEWEPPEEGDEDIGADEDDEESVAEEDEMDGFLDDENDETNRRQIVDLQAQSSGICWEDRAGHLHGPKPEMMHDLRLEILLPKLTIPIDPFSTAYWETEETKTDNTMLRPPLKERSSNTANSRPDNGWPIASQTPGPKKGSKPGTQKSMNEEEMETFKAAIVGSTISKQEMVLRLKSLFPNLTAVFVKDTLNEKFAQVGKSKSDKKWVFVSTS